MNSIAIKTLASGGLARGFAHLFQTTSSSAPNTSRYFHVSSLGYQTIKKAHNDGKNRLGKSFKTIEFKEKIEDHDLQSKINHMRKWLAKGHTIRAVIFSQHQESSRTDHIYNNLVKELGVEGKFDSKKIAGKDIRFTVDPITAPNPADNNTSKKDK